MKQEVKALVVPLMPAGLLPKVLRERDYPPVLERTSLKDSRRNGVRNLTGARLPRTRDGSGRWALSRHLTWQHVIKTYQSRGVTGKVPRQDKMATSSLGGTGCQSPLDQEQRDRSDPDPRLLTGQQQLHQTRTLFRRPLSARSQTQERNC